MADSFHHLAESLDSLWFFNNVLISPSRIPTTESEESDLKQSKEKPLEEIEIGHEDPIPILGSPVIEEEEEKNVEKEEEEGGRSAELVFDSKAEPVSERRKRMMRKLRSGGKVVLGEIEICFDNVWADGGAGGSFGRLNYGSLTSQRVKVASPVKDSMVIRRNLNHAVSCTVKC